jgi:hypothetical protein
VLKKKDINPFVITPSLQYSNASKLIEIEGSHNGLPLLDYRSEKYVTGTLDSN